VKWRILIPTIIDRREQCDRLVDKLRRQIKDHRQVAVIYDQQAKEKDGGPTTGENRNFLVTMAAAANADYISFVDDDDDVSARYVPAIVEALEKNPGVDCVGFYARYFCDGEYRGECLHDLQYLCNEDLSHSGNKVIHKRIPNHLNPVRLALAAQVPFKHTSKFEDTDYATRLRPLLKTQVMVKESLYDYRFVHPLNRTDGTGMDDVPPCSPPK
jgi:hypothetical protein